MFTEKRTREASKAITIYHHQKMKSKIRKQQRQPPINDHRRRSLRSELSLSIINKLRMQGNIIMKTSFRIRCMLFVVLLSTTRGGLAFQCQRISARPLSSSKSSSLYSTYFFHSSTTTSLQGSYSSSLSWSRLRMSTSNAQSHDTTSSSSSISQLSSRLPTKSPLTKKVPITLLSGFLGSGKTTTLKHLLENRQGIKVGVVVNDVASVNIDAKLVSSPDNTVGSTSSSSSSSLADGILELQNGCACCSLADELLTTIDTLIESRKINKGDGCGDDNSFDAICVELSGVADPTAIKANWDTAQLQGLGVTQKAELVNVVTLVDASTFGSDFLSWDMAGQRPDWVNPNDECGSDQRKVAELLAEQIEAADILIMNKADIASEEQLRVATALARTINDGAKMEVVEYGKVTPRVILPVHRRQETTDTGGSECTEKAESHCDHGSDCHDHSHSHGHEHQHDDNSHDHSHEHEDQHRHQHHATDTENLGIISFVYRATRPFDTRKLLQVIQTWPVPIKDELDLDPYSLQQENDESDAGSKKIQFQEDAYLGVLRSKGFCWLAPTKWDGPQQDSWRHDTAMYWSHAGKHFGIKAAGRWWGTLTKEEMKQYFATDLREYDRILKEDFVSEKYGDRRQELVFIGMNIDEEKITNALNACLLSDKGMERYEEQLRKLEQ